MDIKDSKSVDDEGVPLKPKRNTWRPLKMEDAKVIDAVNPNMFALEYKRHYNDGYVSHSDLIVYVTKEEYNSVHWTILMIKMEKR